MAIHKSAPRLNRREAELRKAQLRREQFQRDKHGKEQRRKIDQRRQYVDRVKGGVLILAIIGFFALVYWLGVSDLVPRAY